MSDNENEQEKPFAVERAKTGRAKCKKCKCPIEKDTVRIAKLVANPFSDGKMKAWHHLSCLFEVFSKQRSTTKRIDDPEEDISGWENLSIEEKADVLQKIEQFENSSSFGVPKNSSISKKRKNLSTKESKEIESKTGKKTKSSRKNSTSSIEDLSSSSSKLELEKPREFTRDDNFVEFQRLCKDLAKVDAYTEKTAIVKRMLSKGCEGDGFKSDTRLWCRMLLPGVAKRIYNLQSKQLIKLFSRVLLLDKDEMLEHLEQGDVAETIRVFFERSTVVEPAENSVLTVQEVDEFLETLSHLSEEEGQIRHFRSIVSRCTAEDLKMIIRLIKHDLRINAGPKHILAAIHEHAYEAFQTSRDLISVIDRCLQASPKPGISSLSSEPSSSDNKVALTLMTPVLPMLAEACKSIEMAMKKCPHGMMAEVKYDGERVQVHKRGDEFRYFSRSLKPVLSHKVNLFKDYIPKAFPDGEHLILDSEVLMIDIKTGQPLPFGSLGIHKKNEFKDANVCLFIFDCIYYNGDVLLHRPMTERRQILAERMTEIPNRIMMSEVQKVNNHRDLAQMIAKVFKLGLEGLVLKDVNSKYEPGKRHWLKVKKDYLFNGAMADSADLVVLGAWYGTGNKGGMMSIFLMGCYDEDHGDWVTVTKVHTGHDDATLAMLQNELDMVKIGKDPDKVPSWLRANKLMVPDFVARDPKKQPVWEITGAEFTNQGVHTADGISIRFPRVTRIRHTKDWSTATTLKELRRLFEQSSESMDLSLLLPSSSGVVKEELDSADAIESKLSLNTRIKKEPNSPKKENNSHPSRTDSSPEAFTSIKIKEEIFDEETANIKKLDEEDGAEFYAFVNKDYVEYSASGTPLNWIEGRRPPNGLPADAKPLCSLTDREWRDKTILRGATVSLASGFKRSRRKHVRRMLKTESVKTGWWPCETETWYAVPQGTTRDLERRRKMEHWLFFASPDLVFLRGKFNTCVNTQNVPSCSMTELLGARILEKRERSMASYILHPKKEIPSSCVHDFEDAPRAARHVSLAWLETSAALCVTQPAVEYAVEVMADYCSCPCLHR